MHGPMNVKCLMILTFAEGYLYHYSCLADQSFVINMFSFKQSRHLDQETRQNKITTIIDYLGRIFLMKILRIYSLLASKPSIYEAYSESKGRLVSKKNIFVRHIFY